MEKEIGKVCIYARVSTLDQNVLQQSKFIRKWCKSKDYDVVFAVLDKESATIPLISRKKFKSCLNKALRLKLPVVVLDLNRLTRNWDDVTFIEKHFRDNWNYSCLIATNFPVDLNSPIGRLMFRNLMSFNCYMPEDMKVKQRIGIDRAKREGKYSGRKKGSKNKK